MGRITSNIGLITGIPITDTVDQLMQVAGVPRDRLVTRTQDLQSQQLAINTLTTQLLSLQFDLSKFKVSSLYDSKQVSSTDETVLSASIESGGEPVAGNYQFTPVRTASAQQLVSQRFLSTEQEFAAESFTFRTGGFVNKGVSLEELNGGLGVRQGQIRITDKNGDSGVVDLSYALTVDDVLEAINNSTDINVTAEAVDDPVNGDVFRLTDNTGQTGSFLVQEVNNGNAAADLGIIGVTFSGATTSGSGTDVFTLHTNTRLSFLNDGNGVRITDDATDADDLAFTFRDNTSASVDLSGSITLGDVITKINAIAGNPVTAAISADGNRLELTDNTTLTTGTFTVSNGVLGTTADDLGLTVTAAGATITGNRLISGLADTLISSLNGGQGIGTLGTIDITSSANEPSSIDLSSTETLGDIVYEINTNATNVTAAVNSDGSGIVLTDISGGSAVPFSVADNGGSTVAADLGITFSSTTVTSVNSGALDRQTISEATALASLNGGLGVTKIGDISIIDTDGVKTSLDLNKVDEEPKTVGDVIDAINASTAAVTARINDTGDGIVVTDTAGGAGSITISDLSGSLAADLGLAGTSVEVDILGTPTEVIDGTSERTVTIAQDDTLQDIVDTINALDGGVTASIFFDGQGYRLSLAGENTGAANELLLDLQNSVFQFQETSSARDAILQLGDAQSSSGGILLTSRDNSFNQVIAGLNLTVEQASTTPVTINVTESDDPFIAAVNDFVDSYNAFRDSLDEVTAFDEANLTTGVLFGTTEALRAETDISRALTDRYFGLGTFQSLQQIGVSVTDDGHLEVDEAKLEAAYVQNSEGLENFFAAEDIGVVAKFNGVIDRLAGSKSPTEADSFDGTLVNRFKALQETIDSNDTRIQQFNQSLDRQRELLLLQFFQLESVIAGLQQNLSALDSLQPLAPLSVQ